jgi:hypothetical protein
LGAGHAIRYPLEAGDIVLRATVRRQTGSVLVVRLRASAAGCYCLRFSENADAEPEFTITRTETPAGKDAATKTLDSATTSQNVSGAFELTFSAIGNTLTVYAGREKVLQVRDGALRAGEPVLAVDGTAKSLFKNVQIRIPGQAAPAK